MKLYHHEDFPVNTAIEQKRKRLKRFVNFYPPFLGAGVRIKEISEDLRTIEVHMPLRFWNKNYVGTHFGGSLYAMCDPFFCHGIGPRLFATGLARDWMKAWVHADPDSQPRARLHRLGQGGHHS